MKKKYWYLFCICILLIPIIINFLLLIPAVTPIVGTNTDWLRFWSSYLGLIIAIIIPTTVCYFSLKENRIARNEQIKKELLQEYKNACLTCGLTYLPNHMSDTLYFSSNFEEIQKTLKEHKQNILQAHLNFKMHSDLASENMKSYEQICFEWHNYLLNDAFSIVKGLLIENKERFKEYIEQHRFHKSIPNIDIIIASHFNNGKYVFTLTILGVLIKQYLIDNNAFTELYKNINQIVSFDAFLSELKNK